MKYSIYKTTSYNINVNKWYDYYIVFKKYKGRKESALWVVYQGGLDPVLKWYMSYPSSISESRILNDMNASLIERDCFIHREVFQCIGPNHYHEFNPYIKNNIKKFLKLGIGRKYLIFYKNINNAPNIRFTKFSFLGLKLAYGIGSID